MTKRSNRSSRQAGFTLVELLIAVMIISILASLVSPRFDLMLQKANQATTRGNLGNIRSGISIYYADMEGRYPMANYANGYASNYGLSMTTLICPRYLNKLPVPILRTRVGSFNGFAMEYDSFAQSALAANPPEDVFLLAGPPGSTSGIDRPWVYDTVGGLIYICNDNLDTSGNTMYLW